MFKLDNSKRGDADRCFRLYYWKNILGLQGTFGSTALRYGHAWHAGLDGYYSHIFENGWSKDGKALEAFLTAAKKDFERETAKRTFIEDYRTLPNLFESFLEYLSYFSYEEGMMKVLKTEQVFQILMEISPEEELFFPGIQPILFTGRRDLEVLLDDLPWGFEHKTTGQSLGLQESRLHRSAQLKGYSWAMLQEEDYQNSSPEGIITNFHKLSSRKSPKTGEYGKLSIDFKRSPQLFTKADLENWRLSFLDTAWRIQQEEKRGLWPMSHNCYVYGKCTYCNLCEQNAPLGEENTEGYIVEHWDVTKED